MGLKRIEEDWIGWDGIWNLEFGVWGLGYFWRGEVRGVDTPFSGSETGRRRINGWIDSAASLRWRKRNS
jgi:hypothetical protein